MPNSKLPQFKTAPYYRSFNETIRQSLIAIIKRKEGKKMLTKEELNEIKNRAEKATPGPWSFDGDFTARINGMFEPVIYAGYGELVVRDEDVDFITSAHTDITKLVAEVERLRETIKIAERELWWGNAESACVRVSEILEEAISNV